MGNASSALNGNDEISSHDSPKDNARMPLMTDAAREVLFSSEDEPVHMDPSDRHKFIYHALEQVEVALGDLNFPYSASILNANIEACRYIVLLKRLSGVVRYHWIIHIDVGSGGKIIYNVNGDRRHIRRCNLCSMTSLSVHSSDVEFEAVRKGVHEGFCNCFEDSKMKQNHIVDISPSKVKNLYGEKDEPSMNDLFLNTGYKYRGNTLV